MHAIGVFYKKYTKLMFAVITSSSNFVNHHLNVISPIHTHKHNPQKCPDIANTA